MNPINELRLLAEDLHSAGGHSRYAAAMSKAADELGSLERYRTAYNEWVAKTEWVQADTTLPAQYLGMHRADVLKGMISELFDRLEAAEKERDELQAKIEQMERQKPVGKFIQHPSNGLWEQDGYGDNPDARPLYALPGAQGE